MPRRSLPAIAGDGSSPLQPSLRERKHLRARQTILDEATRLFLAGGYSNTTLKDIADAAETSIATIVRYFGSKDAILLHRERAVVSELAERVGSRAHRTLSDGVRGVTETSFLDLTERSLLFEIMITEPECVHLLATMRREWENVVEELFLQFCPKTRQGRLRAKSLAYMLAAIGMANTQFWHENRKRFDLRTSQQGLIDEFITAFVEPLEKNYDA
ncbi:TetR/AcrR family transcriptional regulator [Lichenicoccus sp.]|uniref:TetR/AcrR family transcriptional regulator n=1 Tax=Lichenicoccus sp. TaxID=2781899 RepID=UPI003D0CD86D